VGWASLWETGVLGEAALYVPVEPIARLQLQLPLTRTDGTLAPCSQRLALRTSDVITLRLQRGPQFACPSDTSYHQVPQPRHHTGEDPDGDTRRQQ